ncbi:MAG: hypothetical protein PHP92_05185 [Candidatus Nanoarchaeia archaeon]|nr:hypothetical protein [Candidatus Nanoarchaeia archaeon]
MNNLINNLGGWISTMGGIVLILALSKLAWSGSKKLSIALAFFAGCIGVYLVKNPTEMYIIGKQLTTFAKSIFMEV